MIWIDTSAYTATFPVYKDNTPIGRINAEDFGKKICIYCRGNNDFKVLLTGNSKFLNKFKTDIEQANQLEYSDNKEIEVKINEAFD